MIPVKDIGEDGPNSRRFATLRDLAVDIKQAVLRFIEQDYLPRGCFCDLAAEFRADTSACAGDQDYLDRKSHV